ncbi:peroxiredoxin-like family protein [Costertonia aggregata]|uniref:AhpC/TSA family protein n=1 Tax=Costertonia aggregata TaxID=343403 RepID=A0A7H9ANK9_9FLAO|nr:peroxiredoxin-like family protein [Costertonia aggregata]QLG44963.1 AhpC/TSA family protein [Costertonia aggregata]
MIKPKTKVPDLELQLINDTQWSLRAQQSETFTMLVFYRGLHCPICKNYLEALAAKLEDFSERGVHLIAISCDNEERAKKAGDTWAIPELPVGYNLSIEKAREWGLFISEGIKDSEPNKFSEPAVFLVKPDNTLYASAIQSMPFARPNWDDMLSAIDYVRKNDYPARGGQ